MPIYPYVCTECGHEFDALQKVSDDPLTECPACGKHALRKRLTAPAFKLKGTGWYETDFKHGAKAAQKTEGGDGKEGRTDSGKESAPADKKESGGKAGDAAKGASSGGESKPSAAARSKDD